MFCLDEFKLRSAKLFVELLQNKPVVELAFEFFLTFWFCSGGLLMVFVVLVKSSLTL